MGKKKLDHMRQSTLFFSILIVLVVAGLSCTTFYSFPFSFIHTLTQSLGIFSHFPLSKFCVMKPKETDQQQQQSENEPNLIERISRCSPCRHSTCMKKSIYYSITNSHSKFGSKLDDLRVLFWNFSKKKTKSCSKRKERKRKMEDFC